jgi:hypothetical protein
MNNDVATLTPDESVRGGAVDGVGSVIVIERDERSGVFIERDFLLGAGAEARPVAVVRDLGND